MKLAQQQETARAETADLIDLQEICSLNRGEKKDYRFLECTRAAQRLHLHTAQLSGPFKSPVINKAQLENFVRGVC